MSLLRAIFRLFSELTEATTATVDDWLAIQKSGETQLKKIKPTNLPYAATSHAHGNLTSDGKLGSIANRPLITGTSGAITTGSFGTSANTFCEGDDSRLSNSRTPTSHSHAIGDLPTTTNNPAALGTAAPGTATTVARSNHVHPMPTAADVGALPNTGGTVTGDISLSAVSGSRTVNIGVGRTSAGWSYVRFFCLTDGVSSSTPNASIFREGSANGKLTFHQETGSGEALFRVPAINVRNQANSAYAPIDCGAIEYDSQSQRSDPRLKRSISCVTSRPVPARALRQAMIRFRFRHEHDQAPERLGFDAMAIREIFPEISRTRPAHPDYADEAGLDEVISYDMTGLVAALTYELADLADRLEVLERAEQRSPRA